MVTVAVIPARGGSKGIPRKNMRLMNGKPLISYAIENALKVESIDAVVVTSDSDEILSFARQYEGVTPFGRDSALAKDAVTLDPVVYDAVTRFEKLSGGRCDVVVTLQPTSPLLSAGTLRDALDAFAGSEYDTMVSVVNEPHLSWTEKGGRIVPNYEKRLNRQLLPPNYLETGAFLITRRECLTERTRIGNKTTVYEMPAIESTDIDTRQDWVVCEALLSRKRIAFRVDGYKELGLGHIYRALTLAYSLTEHEVVFLCDKRRREGIEKLNASHMRVVEIEDDSEVFDWLRANQTDIFVNDCLDTDLEYIRKLKSLVKRVVTFEDLGDGAREADAVVNAIYEGASPHSNVFAGHSYVALRDEFMVSRPKPFSDVVRRVLVIFGGTDPSNLSLRIYRMAQSFNSEGEPISFDFILGPGCSEDSIVDMPDLGICVYRDVARVSDYMRKADLAFSSQGRTTFELASMGVPAIILAQNQREQLHRFAQMDNGFINLGLGSEVSDGDIEASFRWLLGAASIRREMHRLMLENDLKSGLERVKKIILGEL